MSTDPRPIAAAFFDIDGTLTSFTAHEVPASALDALAALRRAGVRIFICTGRSPSQAVTVLDTIPVTFDGYVTFNGQYCLLDERTDEGGTAGDGIRRSRVIAEHPLDTGDLRIILDWLAAHPHVVSNFGEKDYVYFNHVDEGMRATWKSLGKTAPPVYVDDPARALTHPTYQVSPYITPDEEAELVASLPHVTGVRWHPAFTDLIPADGGKPAGMRVFAAHFGFALEHTIAFGDGGNDIAMIEAAGVGVAMGNARDNVKAAADYVTDDVDHGGIANALRRFGVIG
ncbi:Cof-type HAD-IIB family hydrolase [Bifidobacterium avesanii]|uniref:Cof-type HAD-IIB family hydrolase n=1 Tax=Bifidobacterium avesanii TaxID=1798157 RepID=A0A7K3THA0_9BIFI|nr:Cof-type HAD-IIB family hydrolase [Bifidobacterium avesanii]KAB8292857.1 hydrolase [Bifidobacterium avesanii]NEG78461.1 Cof-type HAD-IIB family hydrolase [Bifidobacterium avesanii]